MKTPPEAKTVLLTGAGRGIGRAIAADLARRTSMRLLLVSKSASVEQAAAECHLVRAHSAEAFTWDLADPDAPARRNVLEVLARAGGPVALVHAAAILGPTGPFADADMDEWWQAMAVNLGASVRLVHDVLARMLEDGAGRIVLFAGGGAAYGYPGFSSYGVAKAALTRFAETLALEVAERGPIISIIAPGANETDMLAQVRKAGGDVRTTVGIDEPCLLVRRLLVEDSRSLHGRFVHVRDDWESISNASHDESFLKLRRVDGR